MLGSKTPIAIWHIVCLLAKCVAAAKPLFEPIYRSKDRSKYVVGYGMEYGEE